MRDSQPILGHTRVKKLMIAAACCLSFAAASASDSQDRPSFFVVTGAVASELGDPIPNANLEYRALSERTTWIGFSADKDGKFRVEIPEQSALFRVHANLSLEKGLLVDCGDKTGVEKVTLVLTSTSSVRMRLPRPTPRVATGATPTPLQVALFRKGSSLLGIGVEYTGEPTILVTGLGDFAYQALLRAIDGSRCYWVNEVRGGDTIDLDACDSASISGRFTSGRPAAAFAEFRGYRLELATKADGSFVLGGLPSRSSWSVVGVGMRGDSDWRASATAAAGGDPILVSSK